MSAASRSRQRSISEPLLSGNFTRDRLRKTDLAYERGKDKLAHWIGAWGYEEVCTMLQCLVSRCRLNQMEYLWTVMESVPHRDFLYTASSTESMKEQEQCSGPVLEQGLYRPLSTPFSRKITARLNKSRYIKNKQLYRARSIVMHESFQTQTPQRVAFSDFQMMESPMAQSESQLLLHRSFTPKLPGFGFTSSYSFPKSPSGPVSHSHTYHGSTHSPVLPQELGQVTSLTSTTAAATSASAKSRFSPFVSTRILTPMRRHMTSPPQSGDSPRGRGCEEWEGGEGSPMLRWAERRRRRASEQDSRAVSRSSTPSQKFRSGAGRVGPAEGEGGARPQSRITSRSTTGRESRTTAGLESRPATRLGSRATTGLESRPTTGLRSIPTSVLESTFITGLESPRMESTSILELESRPPTRREVRSTTALSNFSDTTQMKPLSSEVLDFLNWFSNIRADWQQQELLQMVVWNLDKKELYFLSVLLMNRQYRDYVTQLPETLAFKVLSYVPAKTILSKCCQVSRGWNSRCSSKVLWKIKARQTKLGLSVENILSWKELYLDDLKLKKNWTKGRCVLRKLVGHENKVTSVCLKDNLLASGSSDTTVRLWDITTGDCFCVLEGHTNTVWSICFYGKDLLISGSGDGQIKIWNYRTGVCERTLSAHMGCVWAIQQKKELLVSGGQDKLPHLLNPKAQLKWRQCSHLPQAMVFAQAVTIGDSVYFGSGTSTLTDSENVRHRIYRYSCSRDRWTPITHCPVVGFGMVNFEDHLTLVGGAYESQDEAGSPFALTGDVHVYSTDCSKSAKSLPGMPTARLLPTVLPYGSTVMVACGGLVLDERRDVCLSTVEVYSQLSGQWYTARPLPFACIGMSYACVRDYCYFMGGFTDTEFDHPTTSVFFTCLPQLIEDALGGGGDSSTNGHGGEKAEREEGSAKLWQKFPDSPRFASSLTALGECLVAIGGSDEHLEHKSGALHVYSPLTGTWLRVEDIPVACFACTVPRLPQGELLIIGGMGHDEEDALKTVFRGRVSLD